MPGTAEHRMVGYPVLDAELAKPPVCQIDLHLGAQPPLRADRKDVSHNQHPDHQYRIDRRPTCVRVVGRKLLVHPIKIENAVDLPDQMIQPPPPCPDRTRRRIDLVRAPAAPSSTAPRESQS